MCRTCRLTRGTYYWAVVVSGWLYGAIVCDSCIAIVDFQVALMKAH